MKRLYAVFAAATALSLMLSGCGQTVNKNASSLNDLVGDGMSEEQQVQEQLNNFAKDADKNADSSKINGNTAVVDANSGEGEGTLLNAYKVTIDNLVVTEHEGRNVAIVDFTFKNNSTEPVTFAGAVNAMAYQDGMELVGSVFQEPIEGYEPNTTAQTVKKGEKITVQKAFSLQDTTTPVQIQLRAYTDTTGENVVERIFDIAQ
ncbi:MAG: DUF5067 domain-containing protein [Clostridiales bacterium]|nr:DUF5067 domain-containing protein [Clostridiales bacterium]